MCISKCMSWSVNMNIDKNIAITANQCHNQCLRVSEVLCPVTCTVYSVHCEQIYFCYQDNLPLALWFLYKNRAGWGVNINHNIKHLVSLLYEESLFCKWYYDITNYFLPTKCSQIEDINIKYICVDKVEAKNVCVKNIYCSRQISIQILGRALLWMFFPDIIGMLL